MKLVQFSWRQFMALVTKNYKIKIRNKSDTIFEFLFPLLLCGLIFGINAYLRAHNEVEILPFYQFNFVLTAAIPILYANTCKFIMYQVVKEKEINVLNTLIAMNLQSRAYGLSFCIVQSINSIYTSICITLANISIFTEPEDFWRFFLTALVFGQCMIFFSLAATTLYKDPKFSTQYGFLTLFLPVILYIGMILYFDQYITTLVYAMCWIPHMPAMALMQNYLNAYFSKQAMLPTLNESNLILLLCAQVPLYLCVFLYLDSVFTNNQTPLYFLQCLRCKKKQERLMNKQISNLINQDNISETIDNTPFQNLVQQANEESIIINRLSKQFQGVKVVDQVSMQILPSEIVCIIGNNGAGKTTLINMLVGLQKPDDGDATIYGSKLSEDLHGVRNNIRLCQQFDFLFNDLTPAEHLRLICDMRNIEKTKIESEIAKIIKLVMLERDKHKAVKFLSGGQKRKLSLGISLIGDAKFIILDEPTSSLDYESRQQVWDIIKQISKDRSILITTQHIDEADYLADKICILKQGRVLKLETPEELKKKSGYGFRLEISPMNNRYQDEFRTQQQLVKTFVKDIVENSYEAIPQPSNKIVIMIPFNQRENIANLLRQLMQQYPNFCPDIFMNSLEDAYMHIYNQDIKDFITEMHEITQVNYTDGQGKNGDEERNTLINVNRSIATGEHKEKNEVKSGFISQVITIIKLRILIFRKSPRMWVFLFSLFLPRLIFDIFLKIRPIQESEFLNSSIFLIRIQTLIFCLGSGIFIYVQINDYQTHKRQLLRMFGLNRYAYYVGYFIIDYIFYLIPTILIIIACEVMSSELFVSYSTVKILSMLSFGIAIIPITYTFCFIFSSQENAFRNSGIILYTFGFLVADVLGSITQEEFYYNITYDNGYKLLWMIDPFIFHYWTQGFPVPNTHFDEDNFNFNTQIIFSFVQVIVGLIFFAFVLIFDYYKMKNIENYDNNMFNKIEEGKIVQQEIKDFDNFQIQCMNIYKTYKNSKRAVDNVSFGIGKDQILGILGPNGAGKSTLFSILSVIIPRSAGQVALLSHDIQDNFKINGGDQYGIVAQNNLLWDNLTVDEHLDIICKLKGIHSKKFNEQISNIKHILLLNDHSNKRAKHLSGGNKRKLCTAMALLAQPKVIMLDEPSTGLDPLSRKNLFNYLRAIDNQSVVVITQRMDEAENICDYIAIMVHGEFKDIGNPNYLKSKHGDGYLLKVEISNDYVEEKDHIDAEIRRVLPFCVQNQSSEELENAALRNVLKYNFTEFVNYYSGSNENDDLRSKMIFIFDIIINMIQEGRVKDFAIYRSSMEQVFTNLVKKNPSFVVTTSENL